MHKIGNIMNYCEKCNIVTEESYCPYCGNKKMREPNDCDYCFFTNLNAFNFEMFNEALKNNGIEVAYIPYYPQNTISFCNAGRASGRKIYIKYKGLQTAHEIYDTFFDKKS